MSSDSTDTTRGGGAEQDPREDRSSGGEGSGAPSDPGSEGTFKPPTPVRAMMGKPEAPAPGEPVVEDIPARSFEVDGQEWTARAIGWTRSGTAPDTGAPLLLVAFGRSGEDEKFEREALAVAGALDNLSDHELGELLGRSRPFRRLPDPDEREERRTSPVRKDLRPGR